MGEDFPKAFDLVVVGTGITESIVAAAASRIGKTVLHLDRNSYYGGFWASFSLEAILNYAKTGREPSARIGNVLGKEVSLDTCQVENVEFRFLDDSYEAELLKSSRQYNIDLSPTLLYSLGAMVKLLISSNICRYAEFRAIDRVATMLQGEIRTVPCSRSDVFVTQEVNVVEKRIMMKLIETCMELKEEEIEENKEKTFQDFFREKKAPAKVQHYLINALSMSTEETHFPEGLKRLRRFVESLGRYGNSPFLFPMYGCGEIPQCFCRLCAVFGGIYCLQRSVQKIDVENKTVKLHLETGEEISVGNVLFGPKTMQMEGLIVAENHLARGILIVDKPLKDTNEKPKGGGVEFLRLTHGNSEAYLIQLSHYSGCCPKDVYLYHVISTTDGNITPREALKPFVDQVLPQGDDSAENPKTLFEMFFTIPVMKSQFGLVDGIHSAGGPCFALDYDSYIEEAKELFAKLYPEEEFLPRAPEPEEIIMEGYDDQDGPLDDDSEKKTVDAPDTEGNADDEQKSNS